MERKIKHGWVAYSNSLCRCERCRQSWAERAARVRAAKKLEEKKASAENGGKPAEAGVVPKESIA